MGAKLRSELFTPEEQAIVHVMNRCVQQRFLLGYEKETGNEFGHRRQLFENELRKAAAGFAIDLLSYAIMDNHFHLILRSRPEIVLEWSDAEVVLQWHKLCPIFRDKNRIPIENPTEEQVAKKLKNAKQVAKWRSRLSDISWFMKLISQKMAKLYNAEDDKHGHFWEGRFKAVLLLDERALLTCSMYVDLNRIEAALALALEDSEYTSIQRRLQSIVVRDSMRNVMSEQVIGNATEQPASSATTALMDEGADSTPEAVAVSQVDELPDAHLSPIQIDEKNDPIGAHRSQGGSRCSDKGYLPMTIEKYIELLRWTADQIRQRQDGQKFDDTPQTLADLEMEPDVWCKLTTQFTDLFFVAAGMPESVDSHHSCGTNKRFHMPQKTREMLSA